MKSYLLSIFCSVLVIPFSITSVQGQAQGYGYYIEITINSSQVSGVSHTNFPVLIDVSNNDLATTFSGGFVENNNGYDIIFTNSSNSTTYDHQLESYDGASGRVVAWVRIPSLSGSTNTTFRLYFGNPAINTDQSVSSVWDSYFMAVWHMNGSVDDGTSNNNNGSIHDSPASTTGKIGGAYNFDGNNDYITVAHSSSLDITGNAVTLEAWVKAPVPNDEDSPFIMKSPGTNSERYMLGIDGNATNNNINNRVTTDHNNSTHYRDDLAQITNDTWTHVVFTYDANLGSDQKKIYVNGSLAATAAATGNILSTTADLQIAKRNNSRYFEGILDELRVSNIARDANWISTQYNNQNSPSTFYSTGPVETAGGGSPPTYALTGYSDSCIITFDHTKVSGSSPLSNFPVYLDITLDTLRTIPNGGSVVNSNGYDIAFSNINNSMALDFELIDYDPTTGNYKAWVKIPSLAPSIDTEIQIFWGKSGLNTDPSTTNTWDNDYLSVWHFDDGTADAINNNNGINQGSTQISGLLSNARSFNDNNDGDDYIDVGNFNVSGSALTISGWFKADDFDTDDGRLISKADGTSTGDHWFMLSTINHSGIKLRFRLKTGTNTTELKASSGTLTAGNWYYANAVYDGSNMILYLNDSQVGITSKSGSIATNSNKDVFIGNNPPNGNNRPFDGLIDEMRISQAARSPQWVITEYNNQSDPSSFYSLGCEDSDPGSSACGQKIEFVGTGAKNQPSTTLNIPNTATVDYIQVESVFKGGVPSSVTFSTASQSITDHTAEYAVNGGSDKGSMSEVLDAASSVTITPADNTSHVQSSAAYVYRSDPSILVNTFMDNTKVYLYQNSYTKTFTINSSSVSRNIVITIPVAELNADSRNVEITATAGSVSKTVSAYDQNMGESLRLFVITLEDVPGSVTSLTVLVSSPVSNGDSFVAGNILVDVPCDGAQGPEAVNDSNATKVDTEVDINVLGNDSDPDNNLDYSSVTTTGLTPPAHGTITGINSSTGVISYLPDPGYIGRDTFEYMVYDQTGIADAAFVFIDVTVCGTGYVSSGNSGYAQSVYSNNGVANASEALNAPDETAANVYEDSDDFILDLGTIIPSGNHIYITWKVKSGASGTAIMNVYAGTNPASLSTQSWPSYDNPDHFTTSSITLNTNAQYIKIGKGDGSGGTYSVIDFDVDAVQYAWGDACLIDSDGDNVADIYDIDDDNDGIIDVTEGQGVDPGADADGDGIPNYMDADFNGFVDANMDGVHDGFDLDMDGIPNHLDNDSDNDGIKDNIEGQPTLQYTAPVYTDTDGDGLLDIYDQDTYNGSENSDGITPYNADHPSDADPDYLDNDADNDGTADWAEAFDSNKDGDPFPELEILADNFFTRSGGLTYYDNNKDDNNNGIADWMEPCGTKASGTPAFLDPACSEYFDTDGDGIVDLLDPDNFGKELEQHEIPDGHLDKTFRDNTVDAGDPFPVELLSFKGTVEENKITLKWITASEVNNDYFIVEKSIDSERFKLLDKVTANGYSNQPVEYSLTDHQPVSGINYYRLSQTDFDGTTEQKSVIAVNYKNKELNVNYWYQEDNTLKLKLTSESELNMQVNAYNIQGKLINSSNHDIAEGTSVVSLNTSDLASGIYILFLVSNRKSIILKINLQ